MSAEKAFAALGVGAIGSVGTYFAVSRGGVASPVPVARAGEAEKKLYNGKIGKDYENFLLSADSEANEKWWNDSYGELKKAATDSAKNGALATEFSAEKATKGFAKATDQDHDKALNQICKTFYQKAKADIEGGTNGDEKTKKKHSVWTYCSILGEEPKTIKEAETTNPYNGGTSKIGKKLENELLSAKDGTNAKIWARKNDEFFGGEEPDGKYKYFKKIYGENKDRGKEGVKSLKDACKDAYGKESANTVSSDAIPSDEEVKKYCSLLGK